MFTIIIGEAGQYGQRLQRYLETHWKEPLRLYRFTDLDMLARCDEKADCYLLDEDFAGKIPEEDMDSVVPGRRILLSGKDGEGRFCRYHPPGELLEMIRSMEGSQDEPRAVVRKEQTITAVFSPGFDPDLAEAVSALMKPGDLYLGMEDVGVYRNAGGDMGDLCYYIGLRSREILTYVRETARQEGESFFVDSPDLYVDLLELTEEDYRWFFSCLRDSDIYGDVYVGLGSGAAPFFFRSDIFDRFLLLDPGGCGRRHLFCDHMERMLLRESNGTQYMVERICPGDIRS